MYLHLVLFFCIFFTAFLEGPISKHFTVSLHLLFTKHVTNKMNVNVIVPHAVREENLQSSVVEL